MARSETRFLLLQLLIICTVASFASSQFLEDNLEFVSESGSGSGSWDPTRMDQEGGGDDGDVERSGVEYNVTAVNICEYYPIGTYMNIRSVHVQHNTASLYTNLAIL